MNVSIQVGKLNLIKSLLKFNQEAALLRDHHLGPFLRLCELLEGLLSFYCVSAAKLSGVLLDRRTVVQHGHSVRTLDINDLTKDRLLHYHFMFVY